MKRLLLPVMAAGIALFSASCSQAPPVVDTHDADLKAIKDAEEAEGKDFAAKAFSRMADYYADDAILMTNGAPAAVGKEGIRGMSQMLTDMDADLKITSNKAEVSKDLGYTQGTYTIATTNPKTKKRMLEKGTYVTVFKRQATGGWKIVQDINTPDSDPVPVKAPAKAPAKGKSKKK